MATPQNRSSRNGSTIKPGGPSRKNTFQKMLELERRNKIERMEATTSPEIQVTHRIPAAFQTPAPHLPSAPVSAQQHRHTHNPTQDPILPTTISQQTINHQHQRRWAERPEFSNSIDSYLTESFPARDQDQRSQSIDTGTFAPRNSQLDERPQEQSAIERQRLLHGLDENGRLPTAVSASSNEATLQSNLIMNNKRKSESTTKSLSAFNILPTTLAIHRPREQQSTMTGIPQLDGASESKPSRSTGQANARPTTPELQRIVSERSSICVSPSWSARGRAKQREEERRSRRKAAKEAKLAIEKETKAAKEREEKEAKEAKAAKEKHEKEQKAIREKHEKEEKVIREKEEKEREKEAKAANKQQKKHNRPPGTPRKLTKGDRSSSMPVVPSSIPRVNPESRLNSFQSTDGASDSARRSFQSKPCLPDDGFIGGLKLARLRNAAMNLQTEQGEGKEEMVRPVVAGRRFDLDGDDDEKYIDDEEYEKDMVRNAYHLALDSSAANLLTSELPTEPVSRRQTMVEMPPIERQQETPDYFSKPKSPFYQMAAANNSFVDEIFHTIQKKKSVAAMTHPLRSHPSIDLDRSSSNVGAEDPMQEQSVANDDQIPKEPAYDSSSFAARMAKKSGILEKVPIKAQDKFPNKLVETHHKHSNHELLSPAGSSNSGESLRAERLAAAVAADRATVSDKISSRRQVTVLEGVNTKSHSMLIEQLAVGEDDQDLTEEKSTIKETKRDGSKNREGRSSSRESSWFRRLSKDDSKPSIQERRRSRGRSTTSVDVPSSEKALKELSSQGAKDTEKPKYGRRNSISPTINSFKAAAKAAFSKYGPAAPSAKANLPSSSLNSPRPASSDGESSPSHLKNDIRRQTLPSSVTIPSMAKADKVLGESLSSIIMNDPRMSAEHMYGSKSSSLTTRVSDEEVSSADDAISNITTPTASRPTSKKEQLLSLKSMSVPGGRFHEEFSPDFLSALDRGGFDISPTEDSNGSFQDISSIVPTPIASPPEVKKTLEKPNSESKLEDGNLIADAIARVAGFALPTDKTPKQEDINQLTQEKEEEKDKENTPPVPQSSDPNNAAKESLSVMRQPSIKSASMTNLHDLQKSSDEQSKPEMDFSFLPALKHESLVRPSRVSSNQSLQAIAASVLGPPSAKPSKSSGSAASPTLSSPLATPSSPVPVTARDASSPRHSSLPPQNRRPHEQVSSDGTSTPLTPGSVTNSIKASWLAAISNEAPASPSTPSGFTPNTRKSLDPTTSQTSQLIPKSFTPTANTSTLLGKSLPLLLPSASNSDFKLQSNIITHPAGGSLEDPYAKCFLICCGCKRFHDLPTKVFEMMDAGVDADGPGSGSGSSSSEKKKTSDVAEGMIGGASAGMAKGKGKLVKSNGGGDKLVVADGAKGKGTKAKGNGKVLCPWCEHAMTTGCCENWVVCMKLVERMD